MHNAPPAELSVAHWTSQASDRECRAAYHRYEKARRQQYIDYFARHPDLRCPQQAHSANSLTAALPPGCGCLQTLIPPNAWHVHARSGKSSQTLALALLGSAARLDPSFGWFLRFLDLPAPKFKLPYPSFAFERSLSPTHLNETPRVTVLDFLLDSPSFVVAVETKWTEQGLGVCSCGSSGEGSPQPGGSCAERVLEAILDRAGHQAKRRICKPANCPVEDDARSEQKQQPGGNTHADGGDDTLTPVWFP